MYWVPIGGQGARSFWPSGKRCPGFLHPWGSGAGWSVASPGLPVARCWLHTLPVGGGSLPCPGLSCPPPAPLIPGSPGFPGVPLLPVPALRSSWRERDFRPLHLDADSGLPAGLASDSWCGELGQLGTMTHVPCSFSLFFSRWGGPYALQCIPASSLEA